MINGLSRKIWQKILIFNQRRLHEKDVAAKSSNAINTAGG
jgi:hypothetical protein